MPMQRRRLTRLAAALPCGTSPCLVFGPERTAPLTAGLQGGWKAVNAGFDRRVGSASPVGSILKAMG